MKQIDYLKLVATGRKSIHYARPSDADDALTGLAGICFVLSLLLIFAIAILASYLGVSIESEMIAWPLATTVLLGLAYMVCGFFIGGAPKFARYCMLVIGAGVIITLSYLAITEPSSVWYLFVPPFIFALYVSLGAVKQL